MNLLAVGTCSITASQSGNADYAAATAISQSFAVTLTAQTITFANPGIQTVGTPRLCHAIAGADLHPHHHRHRQRRQWNWHAHNHRSAHGAAVKETLCESI